MPCACPQLLTGQVMVAVDLAVPRRESSEGTCASSVAGGQRRTWLLPPSTLLAKLRATPNSMSAESWPVRAWAVLECAWATEAGASTTGCVASSIWLSSWMRLMLPRKRASRCDLSVDTCVAQLLCEPGQGIVCLWSSTRRTL